MDIEETEIIELDGKSFIQLETYRAWPKLGVMWSVRQKVGDSNFPLQQGTEEELSRSGSDPQEVWARLREAALAAAQEATASQAPSRDSKPTSLLGRLFRRG